MSLISSRDDKAREARKSVPCVCCGKPYYPGPFTDVCRPRFDNGKLIPPTRADRKGYCSMPCQRKGLCHYAERLFDPNVCGRQGSWHTTEKDKVTCSECKSLIEGQRNMLKAPITLGDEKFYTCPASVTISGWIQIKARNLEEAKKKAEEMNDVGVDKDDINDPDYCSVVHASEVAAMGGDDQ